MFKILIFKTITTLNLVMIIKNYKRKYSGTNNQNKSLKRIKSESAIAKQFLTKV